MMYQNFDDAFASLRRKLLNGHEIHTQNWQGIDISKDPKYTMLETINVSFQAMMAKTTHTQLIKEIKPNLNWCEEHFEERVGGVPLNPGNSYKVWPHNLDNDNMRRVEGGFSHTYMERFWPKFAGVTKEWEVVPDLDHNLGGGIQLKKQGAMKPQRPNIGIRYEYGDLQDIVNQLVKDPFTRQAYLPIFFPEDTGAVHGERVPCTLGYQFILRNGYLHCTYHIRSCDFIRHFRDDVYLAVKLAEWVRDQVKWKAAREFTNNEHPFQTAKLGSLTMHITSLHCWASERHLLETGKY